MLAANQLPYFVLPTLVLPELEVERLWLISDPDGVCEVVRLLLGEGENQMAVERFGYADESDGFDGRRTSR